jgi:methyl coenzyme M reductase subunit C-like uncharacterized protein (methanogenesis marker protein 7)
VLWTTIGWSRIPLALIFIRVGEQSRAEHKKKRKEEIEKKRKKRAEHKKKNIKNKRKKKAEKKKGKENPLVLPREEEKLPDSPTILLSPSPVATTATFYLHQL